MEKYNLLIVDDDINILEALRRTFRKEYQLFLAQGGAEGLEILKTNQIHVIIADQRMPKMLGTEMLSQALQINPDAMRILLTGYSDIEATIEAINKGQVYRYISKPWNPNEIKTIVKQALETYQLKEGIIQKNRELEKSNLELKKAYEELKILDKAKDNFLCLVTHELKTPISTILSYSESLAKDLKGETAEIKKFIQHIYDGADRLNNLVNEVITLTSFEAGKIKLNPTHLNLAALVKESLEKLNKEIKTKKITIENKPKELPLTGDLFYLTLAISKLIDQAIKLSPPKGKITISSTSKKDLLQFSIEHQGLTIEEENLLKIFDRFLALDIPHHHQGLGLNLPIAKAIIEAHQGKIWAEIKPEKKIMIHFTLSKSPKIGRLVAKN